MKKLTDKELAIMNVLWECGALSMRDIVEHLPEPQSTFMIASSLSVSFFISRWF